MGPKGKTKKSRDKQRRACETASVKRQLKQMEGNLEELRNSLNALNVEYSNKTAELLEKQKNIQVLNKQIFEIDVHLQSLNTKKNSGIWAISNISREINNQQHRIARRKSVFASNNSFLLSYGNIKSLPFSITTNKVGKRKAVPFSDEISPCAKVKQCNETYDVCSLIHARIIRFQS